MNLSPEFSYSPAQHEIFFEDVRKFNVIPKGRRFGITTAGSFYLIEQMLEGVTPNLWGDTITTNIDRYVERLFIPVLRKNKIPYKWHRQKRELRIFDTVLDFRSSDRPENWEGFGYKNIFLNEAGIILKNPYLWDNTVSPMLIDYSDSKVFIAGTPKGKRHKGVYSKFYQLSRKWGKDVIVKQYSTYDNPLNSEEDIKGLIADLPSSVIKQEIYGDFIDTESSMIKEEWLKYGSGSGSNYRVMAVDLAISRKTLADYTAICVMSRDEAGNRYIERVFRDKLSFNEILLKIKEFAVLYEPEQIGIETVQFQAAVIDELIRTTNYNIIPLTPTKDKVTRFYPLAARFENGLIYIDNSIHQEFINELLSFPDTSHDDMVEACSYADYMLTESFEIRMERI